jgi:hypothetical protein
MKQGLEVQARAQRQHDFSDTSNRKAKLKEILCKICNIENLGCTFLGI